MRTTLAPSPIHVTAPGIPASLRRILTLGGPWVGRLEIRLPNNQTAVLGDSGACFRAVLTINDLGRVREIMGRGATGFAESYVAGYWDTPDLSALLTLLASNLATLRDFTAESPVGRAWQIMSRLVERNGRVRSRRNAAAHYDLGNDFFAAWLDRTMTYSAGMFLEGDRDLVRAQERKFRRLAEATEIRPEHHVLEIGCGWGSFATFLAREVGCRVTAVTVSQAQFQAARALVQEAGLHERVDVAFADYRDIGRRFDRIVAVEMFEAVGEAHWPCFFQRLDELLLPGGKAGLQLITIADEHFARYRRGSDFIRRSIFPGGMLPSDGALAALEQRFGFGRQSETVFGADYASTLAQWRARFRCASDILAAQGFDETFRRRWEYYLAYCEAGFRVGHIDVRQLVYARVSEGVAQ